jgi:hypothetical protein
MSLCLILRTLYIHAQFSNLAQWSRTPEKFTKIEICQQSNSVSVPAQLIHIQKVYCEDGGDLKLWAAGRNGT